MSKADCAGCLRLSKQLQVQKADYQFEIKKIQEDKSTDKVMYELHLQKELRRWQDSFHREQSQREDEAHNWLLKYDATVTRYEEQLVALARSHQITLQTELSHLKSDSEQKYQTAVDSYTRQLAEQDASYTATISKMSSQHQQELQKLNSAHDAYVSNLKAAHKAVLDEKIRIYESRLLGLESQKNTETELHQRTKRQAQQMETKLRLQIFGFKRTQMELQAKIENLNKVIQERGEAIQNLQKKMGLMVKDHAEEKRKIEQKHEADLVQEKEKFKAQIRSVYQDTLQYCNKYQESIARIQTTRANEKEQYMQNLEEIEKSIDSRMSRPEDLEEIEALRHMLTKKSKQSDLLSEELKWYRLQLENKEETYNKIFVPLNASNGTNENVNGKRKEFKLRRQGRSVTTVREILQSINSGNLDKKGTPLVPKPKVL